MLLKMIKLNRKELKQSITMLVGFALIYEAIIVAVMIFLRPPDVPLVLEGILSMIAIIYIMFSTTGISSITFTHGVRMGATRRQMFWTSMGLISVQALLLWLLVRGLTFLDEVVLMGLWNWITPNIEVLPFEIFTEWWMLPLIFIAVILVGLILGALILRFGLAGNNGFFFGFFGFLFLNTTGTLTAVLTSHIGISILIGGIAILFIWSIWQYFHCSIRA